MWCAPSSVCSILAATTHASKPNRSDNMMTLLGGGPFTVSSNQFYRRTFSSNSCLFFLSVPDLHIIVHGWDQRSMIHGTNTPQNAHRRCVQDPSYRIIIVSCACLLTKFACRFRQLMARPGHPSMWKWTNWNNRRLSRRATQ